jgi:hypothetical protein
MKRDWLKEVLFAGQTANGFKLGTTLSRGWFWERINGCRIVYRGGSMEMIDFDNVLAVAEADSNEINLPGYLSRELGQTWFYVVRCANRCGQIERTMQAAIKVVFDDDGGLREARPNGVFGLSAKQMRNGKVEVAGLYYPIEQGSNPVELRIYSDGGTGQVDYQNPVAKLTYKGRKFYAYQSEIPGQGWYLFSIRAADVAGNENEAVKEVAVEVQDKTIEPIEIAGVERV